MNGRGIKTALWLGGSLLAIGVAVGLLGGVQANAQSGSGYDLSWWTVDGGGTTSNGDSGYSLGSTTGQPDASVWQGDGYTLAGGFWGGAMVEYRVYLPLVLRNY
jgi:hypothetical protein